MLRNSSSLFFSLLVHVALAFGAFVTYQEYQHHVREVEERKPICLCLSQVQEVVSEPQAVVPPPVEAPPLIEKIELPPAVELPKPKAVKKPTPIKTPKPPKKQPLKVEEPKKIEPTEVAEVTASEVIEITEEPVLPVKPIQKSVEERYLDEHLRIIAQLLRKNLYYPKRARKRHIEGEVVVVFQLLKNGDIGVVNVKQSSREILNNAAIKTIKKLSGKVPKPPQNITIQIPIQFRLKS